MAIQFCQVGLIAVLFLKLIEQALAIDLTFPCYDTTWTYSNDTGKCYKSIRGTDRLNWDSASKSCQSVFPSYPKVKLNLVQFKNQFDADVLVSILVQMGFREPIWTGASRTSGSAPFTWEGQDNSADLSFFDWSGGTTVGNCIEFSYSIEQIPGTDKWRIQKMIDNKDCAVPKAFLCEHTVPTCSNPPGGYNELSMVLKPTAAYPGTRVYATCKQGNYADNTQTAKRSTGTQVDPSLKRNEYVCTGTRFGSNPKPEDPSKYVPEFRYSGESVTPCLPVQCPLYPEYLEHVESKPNVPPGQPSQSYSFGTVLNWTCSRGYVSYLDHASTKVSMSCSKSIPEVNQGYWEPESYQVCVAIRCDLMELINMTPKNGRLTSARNRISEQTFGSQQVNEFNQYANIITVSCDPGYLFNDRTPEKYVACELADGSQVIGQYKGYSGTVLPIPKQCEEATCMYEQAVIQPDYNMKPYFIVTTANKETLNLTKHSGNQYVRGTKIRYFCKDGFESVNQDSDLNITCGEYGQWTPQLIGCIARIDKIPASDTGRFYNEPKEAESASKISSIMFILVFIFLGFILLLDLTTLGRDLGHLRDNIKLQKKRIDRCRNKSKQKNAAESGEDYLEGDDGLDSEIRNRNN